jgi:hypothetical protein
VASCPFVGARSRVVAGGHPVFLLSAGSGSSAPCAGTYWRIVLKHKNFSLSEMACRDGTPVPAEYEANAHEVLRRLQIVRDFFAAPIKIRSGYRTEAHNTEVSGASQSQHLTASAADFVVTGYSAAEVREVLEGLIRIGVLPDGGIGAYLTFTHLDIRGERARWR